MEYRSWKNAPVRTSLLGYGCMRFPTTPEGRIDEPRAEALLNAARDAGVNYFDTAYPYHGGESEPFVGRVIAKWHRGLALGAESRRHHPQPGLLLPRSFGGL